jgi:hypothetical protein
MFAIFALITFASYLSLGPLPKFVFPKLPRLAAINFLPSRVNKISFEQQLDALYLFKSQILGGQNNAIALQRALDVLALHYLPNTRNALSIGDDYLRVMQTECLEFDLEAFGEIALVLEVSERTGAPIGSSLDRIIHKLVSQRSDKQLIATELASVKATISILAALPVIGILLAAMLGTNVVKWYLHSKLGLACLVIGLALEGLGLLWVRSLVAKAMTETK